MPLATNPLGTPYKLTLVWTDLANGRVNTEAMTYDLTKMFVGGLPITITYKSPSTWLSVSDDGNNMLTVALKDNVNIPYTDNKITVTAEDGTLKADGTKNTASQTITVTRNRKPRKGTAADSNGGDPIMINLPEFDYIPRKEAADSSPEDFNFVADATLVTATRVMVVGTQKPMPIMGMLKDFFLDDDPLSYSFETYESAEEKHCDVYRW